MNTGACGWMPKLSLTLPLHGHHSSDIRGLVLLPKIGKAAKKQTGRQSNNLHCSSECQLLEHEM